MQQKRTMALMIMTATLLTVGFQNCSKVGVADAAVTSDKLSGGLVAPAASDPNSGAGGQGTAALPAMPEPTNSTPTPIKAGPGLVPPNTETACTDPARCLLPTPTASDVVELCVGSKSGIRGPRVNNLNGQVVIASDYLEMVNNIGNGGSKANHVVIQGLTAKALTEDINNINGPVILCGMHVKRVNNVHGQLILVNSTVDDLNNQQGTIYSLNSDLGSPNNFQGDLVILTP